jgi:uncharacterized protein DUF6894
VPRFFFDYQSNGEPSKDDVGTVLPSLQAAKSEAATAAAEWIKDHVSASGIVLKLSVRDGQPAPLFVVTASVQIGPDLAKPNGHKSD